MNTQQRFPSSTISKLHTQEYWLSLNPDLSITNYPFMQPAPTLNLPSSSIEDSVQKMIREGTFNLDEVLPEELMAKMANAIESVVEQGFPPVFAYVYDEFWNVFKHLSPLLTPILGEKYRMVTNFWAWHIPANNKSAGFEPHRDYSVGTPTVRDDGSPEMITIWIPLKDITTLNSCMYVLPTNKDPNVPDHLEKWELPQESIQSIRAYPGKAGSIMSWNSQVLHWGSDSSAWAGGPRISIAAYLKRADQTGFTSISIESTQMLTLDFRLGVIGMLMSHYDKADIAKARYPEQLLKFCEPYLYCETNETRAPQKGGKHTPTPSHTASEKVGRNDPCPCGSGKKYKRCCGASA